jgi:L,D-peptidoglycan transpeptidase YkuD (ErfK/YbiS/YcfS/YnhG family)
LRTWVIIVFLLAILASCGRQAAKRECDGDGGCEIKSVQARVQGADLVMHSLVRRLCVAQAPGGKARGRLSAGGVTIACRLGPAGVTHAKREGDGATPAGRFALLSAYMRPGARGLRPSSLPARVTRRDDICCDAPGHALYNRPARLPLRVSHENLWRADHVYDLVIVLDYNLRPRRQARGSAIFFHLTREIPAPTAGCVAISAADMRRLLPRLGRGVCMIIRR